MKVTHIARHDNGGASRAAQRLHRGLLELGHESIMFVPEIFNEEQDPTVIPFRPRRDLLSRLRRRLRSRRISRSGARYRRSSPPSYGGFSDDRTPYRDELLTQLPSADVIHLHVMFQFVDYRTFLMTVPQQTPVVRTMHDMSFFTGGCHYDGGCGNYTNHCGGCPQLGSQDPEDLSHQIWKRKYSALSRVKPGRLHLVAPNRWLATEAKRSSLLHKFPITVIPYGLDTEVFRPRDRRAAREVLGIPSTAFVVLFVAGSISHPLKGFALLAKALNGLRDQRDLLLVSVGGGAPPVEVQVPHLRLGHIGSDHLLPLVYSAADVFVIPSVDDNLPQTVLEATACGTPVVGFAVGGIPDMVRPGVTGWLVPPQDVDALRAAICALQQDPAKQAEMADNCRGIAVQEYALEVQARRHVELYQTMLAEQAAGKVYTFLSLVATLLAFS
jgi:glycosyltransferase involved in cell wall biosynthesis